MLIKDFKKRIKNIDSRLYVEGSPSIRIYCLVVRSRYEPNEYEQVAILGCDGHISIFCSGLGQLSNENQRKLLLACVDMAMTPLDKRKDDHKWNVIIGNDDSGVGSIIAWEKDSLGHGYILGTVNPGGLTFYESIFTDEEFSDLIKYIKTLPDGEYQAKVAEHGKREVKE